MHDFDFTEHMMMHEIVSQDSGSQPSSLVRNDVQGTECVVSAKTRRRIITLNQRSSLFTHTHTHTHTHNIAKKMSTPHTHTHTHTNPSKNTSEK